MSHYRKIDVRIWNDAKFRGLSDDGKLLFMMLMTHLNQTMIGAMRTNVGSLAADLGWSTERLSKALDEALSKGMAKYDPEAFFLWLPNFLKYNLPESPNVVRAWPKAYELLPECPMKTEVWLACEACVEGMGEGFQKAFRSLPQGYAESGAGAGAGAGLKTGGAQDAPVPPDETPKPPEAKPQSPAKPIPATVELDDSSDPMQCAKAMFEHLAVVAPPKTLKLAAEAIRLQAAALCTTAYKAMLLIRRQAELEIQAGGTVNAFWFEDSKWKTAPSPAAVGVRKIPDCPICENRRMVVKIVGGTQMALQCECVTGRKPEETAETAPDGVDAELGARIWTGMNKALKSEIPAQSYETWIRPIKPLGAINGELYLQIPSPDFAHVGDRYDIARFLPAGVEAIHLLSATGAAA